MPIFQYILYFLEVLKASIQKLPWGLHMSKSGPVPEGLFLSHLRKPRYSLQENSNDGTSLHCVGTNIPYGWSILMSLSFISPIPPFSRGLSRHNTKNTVDRTWALLLGSSGPIRLMWNRGHRRVKGHRGCSHPQHKIICSIKAIVG